MFFQHRCVYYLVGINRGEEYFWDTEEAHFISTFRCEKPYDLLGIYCPDTPYLFKNFPEIKSAMDYLFQHHQFP